MQKNIDTPVKDFVVSKDTSYIEVLGKAINVLVAFVHACKRQLSLPEISRHLPLNKNAVFRILHTRGEHGYGVKENQKCGLGPKVMEQRKARLRHTDLIGDASQFVDDLRDRIGEMINLGVLDKGLIRNVGAWEDHHRLRFAKLVGASDVLQCTALRKTYVSCLPFDDVRYLFKSLRKVGARGLAIGKHQGLQRVQYCLSHIKSD